MAVDKNSGKGQYNRFKPYANALSLAQEGTAGLLAQGLFTIQACVSKKREARSHVRSD